MDSPIPLSFVCCVESGPLEMQTRRLVESLRRFGGVHRGAEILAVTPRAGAPLHPDTLRVFREHGVRHLRERVDPRFPWFGYLNKSKATILAEREASAELVVWLDSDCLVLDAPRAFELAPGEDFSACATNKNAGTTGPGDSHEPYWKAMCQVFGLEPDDLPWVTTEETGERIRCYFNSGTFVFRRGRDFGRRYFEANVRVLESGVAHPHAGFFYTDQMALALQVVTDGLRWRPLPATHNLTMRPAIPHTDPEILARSAVAHYRGSMWPRDWEAFLAHFARARPDVHAWLREQGPMRNPARWPWRVVNKGLARWRGRRRAAFERTAARPVQSGSSPSEALDRAR